MIRYAVVTGHPDSGRACTVTASEDGEIVAHYNGYFQVRERVWVLYMDLNDSKRPLPGKLFLSERSVHYEVRPALLPRKRNIQKKPEPERAETAEQLKLI